MRIQHNIAAMNSYRNLGVNNTALGKNLEKLSSGYRINRAGDDAAGLAISEKMRAQITGLQKAQDNANDGIALVQTAEGALTEVHSMLNRMTELANQSANGTYQNEIDRENLQKEVASLKSEIDRIAESTNFNGINLLDGSLGSKAVKGSDTSLTGVSIASFSATSIDSQNINAATLSALQNSTVTDTFEIDGKTFEIDWSKGEAKDFLAKYASDYNAAGMSTAQTKAFAADLESLFNNSMAEAGLDGSVSVAYKADGQVTMKSNNEGEDSSFGFVGTTSQVTTQTAGIAQTGGSMGAVLFGTDTTGNSMKVEDATMKFKNTVALNEEFTMTINGTEVGTKIATATNEGTVLDDGAATASVTDYVQTAVRAAVDAYNTAMGYTTGDEEYLTNTDFVVAANKDGSLQVDYIGDKEVSFSFAEKVKDGVAGTTASKLGLADKQSVQGSMGRGLTLQIGDTADDFNKLTVSVDSMSSRSLGIANVDISTQDGAAESMQMIKDAINKVSSTRGDLGAIQNRLEHTINNLGVTEENMTSAESRIRDTDMAAEMMEYTKNNILIQASQAMLAQANQLPQGVLQLLG